MILDHPSQKLKINIYFPAMQHIVLVIWIEFPPKLYQVTLLLTRKEKLTKCQEKFL